MPKKHKLFVIEFVNFVAEKTAKYTELLLALLGPT